MTQFQLAVTLLGALFALAACGGQGALLQSADGKIRLVHRATPGNGNEDARTEVAATLARLAEVDVIFAHDLALARGAAQACAEKGRSAVRIVTVGRLDDGGRELLTGGQVAAVIDQGTSGAVAIDLALLAVNGIQLPPHLEIGTARFTAANLAAGGQPVPAPGDFLLANLRRQHAAELTTEPMIDVVFRVGVVLGVEDDRGDAALRADLQAAADRYPQVDLTCRFGGDAGEQAEAVRQLVSENFNCILVAPTEPGALAEACRQALEADSRVIVIGSASPDGTCTCAVGPSTEQLGAAAGDEVRGLLGADGGAIVELCGGANHGTTASLQLGFVRALGLQQP